MVSIVSRLIQEKNGRQDALLQSIVSKIAELVFKEVIREPVRFIIGRDLLDLEDAVLVKALPDLDRRRDAMGCAAHRLSRVAR